MPPSFVSSWVLALGTMTSLSTASMPWICRMRVSLMRSLRLVCKSKISLLVALLHMVCVRYTSPRIVEATMAAMSKPMGRIRGAVETLAGAAARAWRVETSAARSASVRTRAPW